MHGYGLKQALISGGETKLAIASAQRACVERIAREVRRMLKLIVELEAAGHDEMQQARRGIYIERSIEEQVRLTLAK